MIRRNEQITGSPPKLDDVFLLSPYLVGGENVIRKNEQITVVAHDGATSYTGEWEVFKTDPAPKLGDVFLFANRKLIVNCISAQAWRGSFVSYQVSAHGFPLIADNAEKEIETEIKRLQEIARRAEQEFNKRPARLRNGKDPGRKWRAAIAKLTIMRMRGEWKP